MAKLEGVVVYTIEKDGCLNGVYANDQTPKPHEVYNEVAKVIDPVKDDKVAGVYNCSWIDVDRIVNGELKIQHRTHYYQVDWFEGKKHVYTGKGFVTGPHQFVVAYTTP